MNNTDTKPGTGKTAVTGIAESNLTAAKSLKEKQLAALNITEGQQTVINGKHVYLTSPKSLSRLFGLPLPAPAGDPFKRRVSQGWGAARYIRNPDGSIPSVGSRKHLGLDFPADVGTPVYASYSGVVSFTGVQRVSGSARAVVKPKVNGVDNRTSPALSVNGGGDVYDTAGNLVAILNEIGDGGIFVNITHGNDFQGYVTQYFHMKEVTVVTGSIVSEGDLIGYVGVSGGKNGWFVGPHLHWQVKYNGISVKPEGLVPSTKFTEEQTGYTSAIIDFYKEGVPQAQAAVLDSTVQVNKNADRSVNAANQSRSELLEAGAKHLGYMANVFAGSANLVYSAIGAFLEDATEIDTEMAFSFDSGVWDPDGDVV